MKDFDSHTETDETETYELNEEEIMEAAVSRRNFLSRLTAAGLGVTALGMSSTAQASNLLIPQPRRVESSAPHAINEKQFRLGLTGPLELSLATSKIAVPKAMNRYAREFAGFELSEAVALTKVLRELRTPVHTLDSKAKETLHSIQTAARGDAFDIAYISAQLDNHIFLRDLTDNYLKNTAGKTNIAEVHTRHMATLLLPALTEHVALTRRILSELTA